MNLKVYNFKTKYPEKLIRSIAEKHAEMFQPYTAECNYDLEYVYEGSPPKTSRIYLPTLDKIINKIDDLR